MGVDVQLPVKRYLSRDEAAAWLGVCVDTFMSLDIPFVDFGPRCKRWDTVDIEAYAEQNKAHNSARTSAQQKGRQTCVSTNAKTPLSGGLIGQTRKVADTAKALGLTIKS
ncbi:hypothetical protein [Magnetovibrio sp.]|uniref:helix-turn-helix transcriptional regulator n=1 Tax=Magnetovibrio sp. TaxID=2024836 RepID=UPI002F94635F